jgi:site-specific recombinase XerD
MAKKDIVLSAKNSLEPIKKRLNNGSNPFGDTLNTLKVSRIILTADQITDCTDNPDNLKTKWEGPFLYEPAGGDLNKDWFVWIKYEHPVTGKYERFRYNIGFNQYKTKTERRLHGRVLKEQIDELLKQGWTPFKEYKPLENLLNKQKTISICIDKYLSEITVRKTTLNKYTFELRLFKDWLISQGLADMLLKDLKKAHVIDFLSKYKTERNWSGKTYNHYLNDITTFLNYFNENYDEYIDKIPTLSLKRARVDRPGNSAYNDWQFKKLNDMMIENGDHLLRTFCSFIYYAALRNISEATKIKVSDFNYKQNTLKIESGTAKNRRTEYIPIYPDFRELLLELGIDKMDPDYYVFARSNDRKQHFIGGPIKTGDTYFSEVFKAYKKELNLRPEEGIYKYKHTRAVHLGEDGEDLHKIMKLFRHRDLATTMIYMRDLGINTQETEFKKGRKF